MFGEHKFPIALSRVDAGQNSEVRTFANIHCRIISLRRYQFTLSCQISYRVAKVLKDKIDIASSL